MLINNVMMILYFLAYVLFYLFLIGEEKIRWKFLLAYSTGIFVLILSAVQLTGLPEMNILVVPALMVLGQFYSVEAVPWLLSLTASLLTNVTLAILNLIIQFTLVDLSTNIDSLPLLTSAAIGNLSMFSCLILTMLLRKPLYQVGNRLSKTNWLLFFLATGLVMNVLTITLSTPRIGFLAAIFEQYQGLLISSLWAIAGLLFVFVLIDLRRVDNRKLYLQKEAADQEFLSYVQNLEESYNDLAAFRHDYQNILLSLDEGIQQNDLAVVKRIYQETIKPSKENIQEDTETIEKIHQIKLVELRSLLRVKLIQAHTQGIQVFLDIPLAVEDIALETVTLLRLISILLDNGIEAASSSEKKQLIVSCFYLDAAFHCLIRNSLSDENINLKSIYQLGVTSKKKGKGLGLYSLKRLLAAHPNVTLITSRDEAFITQELIIR